MKYDHDFWSAIDTLVSSGKIVIDRPKGSTHPRFPYIRYDVDYGYIENTTSMDGDAKKGFRDQAADRLYGR